MNKLQRIDKLADVMKGHPKLKSISLCISIPSYLIAGNPILEPPGKDLAHAISNSQIEELYLGLFSIDSHTKVILV